MDRQLRSTWFERPNPKAPGYSDRELLLKSTWFEAGEYVSSTKKKFMALVILPTKCLYFQEEKKNVATLLIENCLCICMYRKSSISVNLVLRRSSLETIHLTQFHNICRTFDIRHFDLYVVFVFVAWLRLEPISMDI